MPDPKLILDLDGVFADFVGGACVVHGRPGFQVTCWNFYEEWGITSKEFWEPIKRKGDCFYEHIVQPYPWARELLTLCRKFDKDCVFASVAGGEHASDYSGKLRFVRRHFGDMPLIVMPGNTERTPGGTKHLLAAPGRVLVDDSGENVIAWREHGGHAVVFPQYWNAAHDFINNRVEYVDGQLERILK